MIVCSCHAVSDRALRAAAAGIATAEEALLAKRAGSDCGCCREEVQTILADQRGPCRADPCAGCPRRAAA
jgi:bacterioferritin-associated ferredoxin